MILVYKIGKVIVKVKVNIKKIKVGIYEGMVIVREGGKIVVKVFILLIVKELDYLRVIFVFVSEGFV